MTSLSSTSPTATWWATPASCEERPHRWWGLLTGAVGKVVEATRAMGCVALITADHGNAERMVDDDGVPHTAHTTNLVPFLHCGCQREARDGRWPISPPPCWI